MGAPETTLQITLAMDEQMRSQLRQTEGIVAVAEAFEIDSAAMAEAANREIREIKARAKQIEELRRGFLEPAQQIIARAKALFNPALDALGRAEEILKGKLAQWKILEDERVARERREREEAERRARAEAEARAAAERAKAEEAARKAREEAEAAERRRREAEEAARRAREEGDRRAAAEAERRAQAAAAERARREEEERLRLEEGERKAAEIQLAAAAAVPSQAPVQEAAVPAGFTLRDNWVAELEPGKTEDQVKEEIVRAIAAGRTDLLSLLALDMKAASKLAKALTKQFNVPGLRAVNKPVPVSRVCR